MVVEFRWEDIKTGEVHRRERIQADANHFVKFQLWDLPPTDNLRVYILDNEEQGHVIAEILFER